MRSTGIVLSSGCFLSRGDNAFETTKLRRLLGNGTTGARFHFHRGIGSPTTRGRAHSDSGCYPFAVFTAMKCGIHREIQHSLGSARYLPPLLVGLYRQRLAASVRSARPRHNQECLLLVANFCVLVRNHSKRASLPADVALTYPADVSAGDLRRQCSSPRGCRSSRR